MRRARAESGSARRENLALTTLTPPSVGERLLERGDPASPLRLVVLGGLHVLQLDRHRSDLAGKLERDLVRFGHRRAFVDTDVGALVGREHATLGALDPPRRNLLAVDEERALAALAEAASVVRELEADGCLPGR